MKFIADFHIHSHYSLATSKHLTPQYLDYWAKIKGINLIGTGDFTHPKWLAEMKENFLEAENGIYALKKEKILPNNSLENNIVRFMLTAEISNIYKKGGKVRKIHNIILAPDFETVEKIQKILQQKNYNISSDGRPILGLDSRDLFEILLNINDKIVLIPAHIWTPWFAALGSKSGFDTIEECYGDLTKYIFAVETGLSSDQPHNWLCSFLDKFTLISNSDAHSPEKLGRNANIFNTDLNYPAIINALKNQNSEDFEGTIDMYPQEGKYFFDGHRTCKISLNPTETMKNSGICPVCKKPLTLGVTHRIAELSDRNNPFDRPFKKTFKYIIPLKEIIAEVLDVQTTSKNVDKNYTDLILNLGSEFDILLNKNLEEIEQKAGKIYAIAIEKMRNNNVYLEEGYDGEYGNIKLFTSEEIQNYKVNNIIPEINKTDENFNNKKILDFDVDEFRKLKNSKQNDKKQFELFNKNI